MWPYKHCFTGAFCLTMQAWEAYCVKFGCCPMHAYKYQLCTLDSARPKTTMGGAVVQSMLGIPSCCQ